MVGMARMVGTATPTASTQRQDCSNSNKPLKLLTQQYQWNSRHTTLKKKEHTTHHVMIHKGNPCKWEERQKIPHVYALNYRQFAHLEFGQRVHLHAGERVRLTSTRQRTTLSEPH